MIVYILINIAIVVLITGFNLYRHQMQHLSLSAMLLSITINAFINTFIIDKYNFITLCTITMFIIWTILQFYIDKKLNLYTLQTKIYCYHINDCCQFNATCYRLFKYTINIYVYSIFSPCHFHHWWYYVVYFNI